VPADEELLPDWWRRKGPRLRCAVAIIWVAAQLATLHRTSWVPVVVAGSFLLYSLGPLFYRRLSRRKLASLTLIVDTVFYLILAALGVEAEIWLNFTFFLYLMLSAALLYRWKDVIVVGGACSLFYLVVLGRDSGVLWLAVLAGMVLAIALAHQRETLEGLVAEMTEDAAASRILAERARDEERKRIAADLHDGPLQSFISFQVRLEVLKRILERDKGRALEELEQLQDLWRSQVAELRSFVRSMRPAEVEGANLLVSLRRAAETFQKDSGVATTFVSENVQVPAPAETALEVLQIFREALHNAQKHSKASRVAVTAEKTGRVLAVRVADDGTGFPFSGSYTLDELELLRMGPVSIKQRVRKLSGELTVNSRPGKGAELNIRIPL
jgi:signal transduction histidine kinase